MTTNGYKTSFACEQHVLKVDYGNGCTTLNILKAIDFYTSRR